MSVSTWNTQIMLYGVLAGDATLNTMVTAVVEEVEQNQKFPYIILGEQTGTPDDILDVDGDQQTYTMHVWDKDAPISRIKKIMDRMKAILHNRRLSIQGVQTVNCIVEFSEVMRDVDTLHGVMRVRIISFG
jgi:hypothetical protein